MSGGAEIGADGLFGRQVIGKGVAVFCQVDPERSKADQNTYFQYTRWRSTRAVAQLLANLDASFSADGRIFHPVDRAVLDLDRPGPQATGVSTAGPRMDPGPEPERVDSPGSYCPDYRTDFPMGDNPYRYYRW